MMRKKYSIQIFFTCEILLFAWLYYAGNNGIQAMHALDAESKEIEKQITQARSDIALVEKEIMCWREDDFYKEKLAREELHMGKSDEEIYLI